MREEYKGSWHEDKMHGFGIYKYISGAVYSGEWVLNRHEGKVPRCFYLRALTSSPTGQCTRASGRTTAWTERAPSSTSQAGNGQVGLKSDLQASSSRASTNPRYKRSSSSRR